MAKIWQCALCSSSSECEINQFVYNNKNGVLIAAVYYHISLVFMQ